MYHFPPLSREQDFEQLCRDLWAKEWGYAEQWGTRGEKQHGVDVLDGSSRRAIQCKLKDITRDAKLAPAMVRSEVEKAKNFRPELHELTFATTSARTTKLQAVIAELDEELRRQGLFAVRIAFWDDIEAMLEKSPELIAHYYPWYGKPIADWCPQLPDPFITRPDLIDRCRSLLLDESARVGLQGMGGCGKTVLATTIARDAAVQERFRDRILWVNVGHGDPLAVLRSIVEKLGGSAALSSDIRAAKDFVRDLIAGRQLLLILDDVWTTEQAFGLDVVGDGGGLLVTSRRGDVLQRLGAEPIDVDVLSADEATAMLEAWGSPSGEIASAIAAECGNLPLALAMAGALARQPNRSWDHALRIIREQKLEKLEAHFRDYEHPTLLAAMAASVDDLRDDERSRYLDLAVFGSEWVPVSALELLWNDGDLVTTLVERSLAFLDGRGRVRLHDLQADYVRVRAGELRSIHHRLIEAYRTRVAGGDFANAGAADDDGYFFERLPFHLVGACAFDELEHLLFHFRWLSAKLLATDANAVVADYALLGGSPAAQLIKSAVRLAATAVARDPEQFAGQLLARLPTGMSQIERLLAESRAWGAGRQWLRPTRPGLQPAGGCLQQTLIAGGGTVRKLECRGARQLDTYYGDGLVRTWDLDAGSVIASAPHDLSEEPFDWSFSERETSAPLDANREVVGWESGNGKIGIRDRHTGELEFTIDCDCPVSHPVYSILALDPRRVLAGSHSHIGLWDLVDRKFVTMMEGHTKRVTSLERIDADRFASGSEDGLVRVWDISEQALAATAARHSQSIQTVCATPRAVVSSSYDDRVLCWSIDGETPPIPLVAENAGWATSMIAWSDHVVVSGSVGFTLRIWNVDPPATIAEFQTQWKQFPSRVLSDGLFATRIVDGHAFVIRNPAGHVVTELEGEDLSDLVLLKDRFYAIGRDALFSWDVTGGRKNVVHSAWKEARFVAGRWIVHLTEKKNALRWRDLATGATGELSRNASSWNVARGSTIVWRSDAKMTLFDLATNTVVCEYPDSAVHAWKWLDDERVVTCDGQVVSIWSYAAEATQCTFTMDGEVKSVSVLPEERLIAVGDSTGSVQILRIETT